MRQVLGEAALRDAANEGRATPVARIMAIDPGAFVGMTFSPMCVALREGADGGVWIAVLAAAQQSSVSRRP